MRPANMVNLMRYDIPLINTFWKCVWVTDDSFSYPPPPPAPSQNSLACSDFEMPYSGPPVKKTGSVVQQLTLKQDRSRFSLGLHTDARDAQNWSGGTDVIVVSLWCHKVIETARSIGRDSRHIPWKHVILKLQNKNQEALPTPSGGFYRG
jgi:hypothetical protein